MWVSEYKNDGLEEDNLFIVYMIANEILDILNKQPVLLESLKEMGFVIPVPEHSRGGSLIPSNRVKNSEEYFKELVVFVRKVFKEALPLFIGLEGMDHIIDQAYRIGTKDFSKIFSDILDMKSLKELNAYQREKDREDEPPHMPSSISPQIVTGISNQEKAEIKNTQSQNSKIVGTIKGGFK